MHQASEVHIKVSSQGLSTRPSRALLPAPGCPFEKLPLNDTTCGQLQRQRSNRIICMRLIWQAKSKAIQHYILWHAKQKDWCESLGNGHQNSSFCLKCAYL